MSILANENSLKAHIVEIPFGAPEYPSEWRRLSSPPERLYAVGNVRLLGERKFAVVGSRRTPSNAMKLGAQIAEALSAAFVVVTGAADGGDSAAIEGALKRGRVICLLAGGFSALPQGNLSLLERVAERGLIVSEHPFFQSVRTYSYERRNALLAALGEGTLVLGAGEKSGALITAKYAKRYGREVFALPYPPNAASGVGCNRLIKEGARLVENAEDVANVLGVRLEEKKRVPLTLDEERLYETLREGEAHATELAAKVGMPVFRLLALLSALEAKGLAVSLGGNRYAAI